MIRPACPSAPVRPLCLALAALLLLPVAALADKIPVKSADDLPRHTYKLAGSASDAVRSEDQMAALAKSVRKDVLEVLEKYDIQDPTTLQRYHLVLMNLAMLGQDWDGVLEQVAKVRALEQKESARLTSGLASEVIALARKEARDDNATFAAAFKRLLAERIRAMPWKVVEDDLEARRAGAQVLSESLLIGQTQAAFDPVVARTGGEISGDIAQGLLGIRAQLTFILPIKDHIVAVLDEAIAANRVTKPDIWQERDVVLPEGGRLTPVIVAVWDSGVDVKPFVGQLWTNEKEKLDGQDSDGNGFVDDVHGIAFDLESRRVPELLCSVADLSRDVSEVSKYTKGLLDLQAAIESEDAAALRAKMAGLKPDEVKPFMEDLGLFGNYIHGTHVAGIAAAGNPYARLLVARITFDHRIIPRKPSLENAQKEAEAVRATVAYFKQSGARVVNMSWGGSRDDVERALEANGMEKAEERAALARQIFAIQRESLETSLRDAPDILFICAAGNADNDVEFSELIPAGIDLPNLLVVGAVDQAGDPTSFTSFGNTVKVYASGFEVDSFIPGGQRMKLSGTSMAAPNATNLAAKLLAQKPDLKPTAVIDLIVRGADPRPGEKRMLLINPKKTMQLLQN